jgi:hypothetical protein
VLPHANGFANETRRNRGDAADAARGPLQPGTLHGGVAAMLRKDGAINVSVGDNLQIYGEQVRRAPHSYIGILQGSVEECFSLPRPARVSRLPGSSPDGWIWPGSRRRGISDLV